MDLRRSTGVRVVSRMMAWMEARRSRSSSWVMEPRRSGWEGASSSMVAVKVKDLRVGGGRRFVVCVLLLWPVVACARGRSFSGEPYTRAYVYGVSNLKYVAPKGIQMCLLNTQLPYVHLRSCTFILFIDVTQRIVLYSSSNQFLCMCNQYYDTLLELLHDFRRFNAYSEDCSLQVLREARRSLWHRRSAHKKVISQK